MYIKYIGLPGCGKSFSFVNSNNPKLKIINDCLAEKTYHNKIKNEFEFQKFFLQNYETVQNSIDSVIINHTPLEMIQFYNKVKFETNSINVKQFEIL